METSSTILDDLALCIDKTEAIIRHAESCPLTFDTVSKRHIRILATLLFLTEGEDKGKRICTDIGTIQRMISDYYYKKHNLSDVRAFTKDLASRRYVEQINHEDYGEVFMVTQAGVDFLAVIQEKAPDLTDDSRTPNHAPLVH